MSLIQELKRRHVFKVAAAYAVVAWLLIQVASVISKPMSLPEWFEPVVLAFLLLGFPIALILAWAFNLQPATASEVKSGSTASGRTTPARSFAGGVSTILVVGAVSAGGWWLGGADERQARTAGLNELDNLIEAGDWEGAYSRAQLLETIIPDDSGLTERWPKFTWRTTLATSPTGATIYRRAYRGSNVDWQPLGNAPLVDIRVPLGLSLLRAELDGHDPVLQVIGGNLHLTEALTTKEWQSKIFDLAPEVMRLDTTGSLPEGKVRVPGWRQQIDDQAYEFRDFFLDRFEVTNLEYKEFVDAGGYRRGEYWQHPIVVDGEELSREDAATRFVDRTGQPGPATWIAGDFPEGMEDHPVSGVSWYEAQAYARFREQSLPTVHHWRRAFAPGAASAMVPESNVDGISTVAVGSTRSLSWTGNFDMAGNVREWVVNAVGEQRYILGGAWNDDSYRAFDARFSLPPINREPGNGFRLAVIRDDSETLAAAMLPEADRPTRDITTDAKITDELFEAYKINFEYDVLPLNETVTKIGSDRLKSHEIVEIDPVLTSLRLPIHLYLPANATPPYQAVIYWPGGISEELDHYDDFKFQFDFLLKSGRAVAFPIYYGSFGRHEPGFVRPPRGTPASRAIIIRSVTDLRRTVDYLASRPDIDPEKIALFGNSAGATGGAIATAVDQRFRALILYTLPTRRRAYPDIDPISFLTRIGIPTLMISGEYDALIPIPEARSAFEQIGVTENEKRLVVAPSGHSAPYDMLVRESLAWYDRHLGQPHRQ